MSAILFFSRHFVFVDFLHFFFVRHFALFKRYQQYPCLNNQSRRRKNTIHIRRIFPTSSGYRFWSGLPPTIAKLAIT
jgi:hypothetical protein